jgi:hypothetical protein
MYALACGHDALIVVLFYIYIYKYIIRTIIAHHVTSILITKAKTGDLRINFFVIGKWK